ncbi:MAG: ABC transporter permease subunit [Deltaproteobacteria bacterium]|nr:ABC transporter permease subunit [Deltaproteobacteria bacterium]
MILFSWVIFVIGLIFPVFVYLVKFFLEFSTETAFYTFRDPYYLEGIIFTFRTILFSVLLSLVLGSASALVLLSLPDRVSRPLGLVLVLSVLSPPFVGAIGYRMIAVGLNIDDWTSLGIAFVQSLNLFPIVGILLESAVRNIDDTLIQSAKLYGLTKLRTFSRIVLPLIGPALVNILFFCIASSLADIGSPLIFEERRFLSLIIFNLITDKDPFGTGMYLVFMYLLMFGLAFVWLRKYMGSIFTETVSSGYREARLSFGVFLKSLLFVIFTIILILSYVPQLYVILMSFTTFSGEITFNNYLEAVQNPSFGRSFVISTGLALLSTVSALALSFFVAWKNKKTSKSVCVRLLDFFSFIPIVFPAVLLAFIMVLAYKGTPLDNTKVPLLLLFIVYTLRKLPQGTRVFSGLLKQLGSELEDAGRNFGISSVKIVTRIYIPALFQIFLRLFVNFFTLSLFETSTSLIIPIEEKWFPLSKLVYHHYSEPENFFPTCAILSMVLLLSYFSAIILYKSADHRWF